MKERNCRWKLEDLYTIFKEAIDEKFFKSICKSGGRKRKLLPLIPQLTPQPPPLPPSTAGPSLDSRGFWGHYLERWVQRYEESHWFSDLSFPNTTGEIAKDCIVLRARKGASLMVWGCFWCRNRGPLVPLPQNSTTSHIYRRILDKYLLPILR